MNVHQTVLSAGIAAVLLAAPSRAALTISDDATQNVNCAAGTCTAAAADAVLNIHDLKTALAAGDLTVSAGSDAADIVVADKFQWARPHRLTLSAFHSVIFAAAVSVEGTGAVTIAPNAGGSGGDLIFTGKGKLAFWDLSSSLIVAGDSYTLVGDLDGLAEAVASDASGHYALARMFDGMGISYKKSAVRTPLTGTFNGLGHAIANLQFQFINGRTGLFNTVEAGGVVRDLVLQNATIVPTTTKAGEIGTLAGHNSGLVSNVAVQGGSVDARGPRHDAPTGGIVGNNDGTITMSSVAGTTVLAKNPGGMAGLNSGTISRSRASAVVHGGNGGSAGGLVGTNSGTILLSSTGGSVAVDPARHAADGDDVAGGVAATNSGTIDSSFSTASVDGGSGGEGEEHESGAVAGGLVGYSPGTIVNSYSRGAVTAQATGLTTASEGGFVGAFLTDASSARATYSTGAVTCNCSNHSGVDFGGYNGINGSAASRSYWDTDTSGQSLGCGDNDCAGVKGRTTAQLKAALPPGFNASIWALSPGINDGYPYLIGNPPQ